MRIGVRTSLILLVVVSVALAAYLAVGVLKLKPFADTNTVTVEMSSSGGLLPKSRVLYNGIEVGSVASIQVRPGGLRVTLTLDRSYKIPASAGIDVENLSLVGEQYVNFSSTQAGGPYITDGAVLDRNVDVAATAGESLTDTQRLIAQIDPKRIESLANTINDGWVGRDRDLATIGEFSNLFSRTVTTQRTEFSALFDHAQELVRKVDGYGPVLSRDAPLLDQARVPFSTLFALFPGLATATDGAVGWTQVITPFVTKINAYLQRLLPKTTPVLQVLFPVVQEVAPSLQLDLGSVVERGLQIVDENGVVRFKVNIPR